MPNLLSMSWCSWSDWIAAEQTMTGMWRVAGSERQQVQNGPATLFTADANVQDQHGRVLVLDKAVRVLPFAADDGVITALCLQQVAHEVQKRSVVVDDCDPRALWRCLLLHPSAPWPSQMRLLCHGYGEAVFHGPCPEAYRGGRQRTETEGDPEMAKIKHIAISTQDVEKTARFYIDVLGLQEVGKVDSPGASGYYLSDGNINLAILNFKNDAVAGAERGKEWSGIHHIGFQVESLDEIADKLSASRVTLRATTSTRL